MRTKVSNSKWNKIADIFSDIAQIFFASVVLPAVLDRFDSKLLISGLIASLVCWITSVVLRRRE